MARERVLMAWALFLMTACSGESADYPAVSGMSPPYVLKEGCKFTIVEELSRTSVTSPEVSGADASSVSAEISLEGKTIAVSDCQIIENSHNLPVYKG